MLSRTRTDNLAHLSAKTYSQAGFKQGEEIVCAYATRAYTCIHHQTTNNQPHSLLAEKFDASKL